MARAFIEEFAKDTSEPPGLSASCIAAMQRHPWSGNVRELQNRVQRALLMCEGDNLSPQDMQLGGTSENAETTPGSSSSEGAKPSASGIDSSSFDRAERETLEQALQHANYVISVAAKSLGVSRQALYRRMQRLGISLKRDLGD